MFGGEYHFRKFSWYRIFNQFLFFINDIHWCHCDKSKEANAWCSAFWHRVQAFKHNVPSAPLNAPSLSVSLSPIMHKRILKKFPCAHCLFHLQFLAIINYRVTGQRYQFSCVSWRLFYLFNREHRGILVFICNICEYTESLNNRINENVYLWECIHLNDKGFNIVILKYFHLHCKLVNHLCWM